MALSEFGLAFLDNLRELTTPDRRSIVTLKDLAFENISEAASVVRGIRQHVKQCPPAHRLPALYLVDCMLKSEPCPPVYVEQLSQVLLEIFVFMWDNSDPSTRASLTKVCKLWRGVAHLDQKVVRSCEAYMVPPGQAPSSAGVPAVGGVLRPPSYGGYSVLQPPRASPAHGLPMATVGNGLCLDPRMVVHHATPQLAAPAPFIVAPAARPVYAAVSQPQAVLYPLPTYMQSQPPQQHVQPGVQQFAYPRPAAVVHNHTTVAAPVVPQPAARSSMMLVGPHASSNVPPVPLHGHAPVSSQQGPNCLQQPSGRLRSTEFLGLQALKELDSTAVQDLFEASHRTRPTFLDAEFLRNKRRAVRASAGLPSRQWYPSVDIWLLGTTSASADPAQAGEEVDDTEGKEDKVYFVEEDPSQPECAISGEPFERFYDPDLDKWCYKDAVILLGEEAVKYGVMDGSIVKVPCLMGAPSKLQMATFRAATTSAAAGDELRDAVSHPSTAAGSSSTPAPASANVDLGAPRTGTAHGHTQLPVLQPPVAIKEEQHAVAAVGAAPDTVCGSSVGMKRAGNMVEHGAAVTGFQQAKRVKLEAQ